MTIKSADLVELARAQLGKPYVFGAEGPNTFDCSGLMQWVYGHFGVKLPRLAHNQAEYGTAVPLGGPFKPGDMVFSSWDGRRSSHVGMYVGNNQIINAPQPGERVKLSTLSPGYMRHVDAVRRVPGVDGVGSPSGGGGIPLPGWPLGVPGTGELVGAVSGIASSLASMTGAFASGGRLAETVLRLALPSNLVRMVAGAFGIGFVFLGLVFLVREVRK